MCTERKHHPNSKHFREKRLALLVLTKGKKNRGALTAQLQLEHLLPSTPFQSNMSKAIWLRISRQAKQAKDMMLNLLFSYLTVLGSHFSGLARFVLTAKV